MPGQVFGTAGSSADAGGSWATSEGTAKMGARGERRTAAVLDAMARNGNVSVFHDLVIPVGRDRINVDHVVVSGAQVLIIDTKVWQPGRYWTLFGATRRGWSRAAHADKRGIPMAAQYIKKQIGQSGWLPKPLMTVWSSNDSAPMNLTWFRPVGAKAVRGEQLREKVLAAVGDQPALPAITSQLIALLPYKERLAVLSAQATPVTHAAAPQGRVGAGRPDGGQFAAPVRTAPAAPVLPPPSDWF